MDGLRELLQAVKDNGLVTGHLRGLFHIAIGRRITRPDGTVVSMGVTWRELAGLLKQIRYEKELVAEIGADPEQLAPRDRQRFWYSAIGLARPDSPQARAEAESLARALKPLGYIVGQPPPPSPPRGPQAAPSPEEPRPKKGDEGKPKKKPK